MEWFRFYHDVLHDPKVQKLSPEMFKNWINVLCIASKNEVRGGLPDVAGVAFGLRTKPCKADVILRKLVYAGLLDGEDLDHLEVHNWNGRQRKSDDSAPRTAKSREQKKGGGVLSASAPRPDGDELETSTEPQEDANRAQNGADVTLQSRDGNALDTDTEERREEPPIYSPPDEPEPEGKKTYLPDGWKPPTETMGKLVADYPSVSKEAWKLTLKDFRTHYEGKAIKNACWTNRWRNWVNKAWGYGTLQAYTKNLSANPNGNGAPPVPSLPDPDVLLRRQMEADERRRQEQARIARGER